MTVLRRVLAGLGLGIFSALAAAPGQAGNRLVFDYPWAEGWLDPGPDAADRERWRFEHMEKQQEKRAERQWTFMNGMVPVPYRDRTSTVEPTPATIAAGGAIYAAQCAGCHGRNGFGDGNAGRALDPSPALLNFLVRMPGAVDSYLLWTVAEGGLPFGSEMPAFKDRLSDEQIWQVIAYMRAGFPGGD